MVDLRSLAARIWSGHRLFIILLTPAVLLRIDAELGYRWQAWFNDSFEYLENTIHFNLDPTRVSGYSVWLRILQPFHSYALITILQHLMGLAIAVMVYELARHRYHAPAWLATMAAVPVLYDGFEIQLEHLIMADVPFLFLLMAATTLLLWQPSEPSALTCAVIGGLLGLGAILRSVGLPLLAIFAVYMIIRRIKWWKVAATVVVFLIPVFGYAAVFDFEHGQFAMTDATGVFLYSRVMTFAECSKMHVPADELWLCTTVPPDKRPIAQDYIWTSTRDTPLDRFPPPKTSPVPNELAQNFAIRAVEAQPLDYARAVFDDTWRVFGWKRVIFPNAQTYDEYIFGYRPVPIPSWDDASLGPYRSYAAYYAHGNPVTQVVAPFANIIRGYQRYVWLPGSVYGLILLAGMGGIMLAWRRLGGEALLPWTISLALIVIPAATVEFDYRYILPAVPFACLAAVMAFSPGTAGGDWLRRLTDAMRRAAGRSEVSAEVSGVTGTPPAQGTRPGRGSAMPDADGTEPKGSAGEHTPRLPPAVLTVSDSVAAGLSGHVATVDRGRYSMVGRLTWLDRLLQHWRIRIALRELPRGARVLDIGTHDGKLFRLAGARGVGIDPKLAAAAAIPRVTLVQGFFPADLPPLPDGSFDAVTALAVIEHVPRDELSAWASALARLTAPHGRLIMTVPAPEVDTILHVLMRLQLVAGMEAHQHHRFQPSDLNAIFAAPVWQRTKHRVFQLGLNHLYLFERLPDSVLPSEPADLQ